MALDAFRKKTEATVNAMDLSFGPNGKDTFSWPQGFASLLVSRIKLVACDSTDECGTVAQWPSG